MVPLPGLVHWACENDVKSSQPRTDGASSEDEAVDVRGFLAAHPADGDQQGEIGGEQDGVDEYLVHLYACPFKKKRA